MKRYFVSILFLLFLNTNNQTLTNGVYLIKYQNLYLNYHQQKNSLHFSYKPGLSMSFLFRINNISNSNNISFIVIESLKRNRKLYTIEKKIKVDSHNNKLFDIYLWSFIKKDENSVFIKNKNGCYLNVSYSLNINCIESIEEASQFYLKKIYEEVNHTEEDITLIEKEPIDILIKYIDLKDPNLKRKTIHQINKDIDNEELRYSIRSILKNIPWVRKIFILMPNEKVRYFKEPEKIKEKIVYVKDKDLIGFDTSSSYAFQFRYWKMKEFNISDNFIAMDDDYFIGRPLKKTDFFYVENMKVVPLIVTSKFLELNKAEVERNIYYYKKDIKKSKKELLF